MAHYDDNFAHWFGTGETGPPKHDPWEPGTAMEESVCPNAPAPEILVICRYQSEGFPQTGYFIPAHVGAGAGQVWGVLPPELFQGRETHERRSRMWPDMGYLSVAKSL